MLSAISILLVEVKLIKDAVFVPVNPISEIEALPAPINKSEAGSLAAIIVPTFPAPLTLTNDFKVI